MGKYFTIEELCASDTAKKKGIKNEPDARARENLTHLIEELLDPIRESWGKPIYVNSGYRCAKLNKAVGGVSNSQHLYGEAADLDTRKGKAENEALFRCIREHRIFDQLIDENNFAWVHVSYRRPNRNQVLKISKK